MAGDGVNVPLLLRTAQTLRERFAALRSAGPISAVLCETPRGHEKPPTESLPFSVPGPTKPKYCGGSVIDSGGDFAASRSLWLGCGPGEWAPLLNACRDANGFVPLVRRHYGLPEASGAAAARDRWVWTVFELAEARPRFSLLALDRTRGPFRCVIGGEMTVAESLIEDAKTPSGPPGPIDALLASLEFGPDRYWQLDDFVEASIAVMDLIEVAIPTLTGQVEAERSTDTDNAVAGRGNEGPEDVTKPGGRRKRNHEGLTVEEWVGVMRKRDPEFRFLSEVAAAALSGGTFGARTIGTCEEWVAMKQELRTAVEELAERAEEELANRRSEDEDAGGFRISSEKHGTGPARLTAKELKHERAVRRFLSEAENRGDKRPK